MFSSDEDEPCNPRHTEAPRLVDTSEWSDIGVPAADVVGVARAWQATLTTMLSGLRDPLGDQKRPLRLQTAFSGIAGLVQLLRDMAIDVHEDCAVELKSSAFNFCKANGLLPGCWFRDMANIVEKGKGWYCIHEMESLLPTQTPDLDVVEFPCRAYSRARFGSQEGSNRRNHGDYKKAMWTVIHIDLVSQR